MIPRTVPAGRASSMPVSLSRGWQPACRRTSSALVLALVSSHTILLCSYVRYSDTVYPVWDQGDSVQLVCGQVGSVGQGCAGEHVSSLHEVLNSVPGPWKRKRRESRRKEFHWWSLTFIYFFAACLLGFLIFPCCVFLGGKKEKAFPILLQLRGPLHCFISKLHLRILKRRLDGSVGHCWSQTSSGQFYPVDLWSLSMCTE